MAIVNKTNVTSEHLLTQMGYDYSDSTKYVASTLFTSGYGVRWAKYKPVKHSVEHHAHTNTDSKYPDWWKADGYCGLKFPKYSSTGDIINVSNPDTLWTIDRPVLGTNPFRFGDFAGYANGVGNKDYADPIITFRAPTITKVASGSAGQVFVTFSKDAESLDIIQDMNGFKNMFLGLILKSGNFVSYFTMDRIVSASSWNDDTTFKYYTDGAYFELPAGALGSSKSYTAYLCLFDSMKTDPETNNDSGGSLTVSYIPMPTAPITIDVKDVSEFYTITGNSLRVSGTSLIANVTIKNDSSLDLVLGYSTSMVDGQFYLRYVLNQEEVGILRDEYDTTSRTVKAKSSSTFDITVYNSYKTDDDPNNNLFTATIYLHSYGISSPHKYDVVTYESL